MLLNRFFNNAMNDIIDHQARKNFPPVLYDKGDILEIDVQEVKATPNVKPIALWEKVTAKKLDHAIMELIKTLDQTVEKTTGAYSFSLKPEWVNHGWKPMFSQSSFEDLAGTGKAITISSSNIGSLISNLRDKLLPVSHWKRIH